jgi:hypothetical protein
MPRCALVALHAILIVVPTLYSQPFKLAPAVAVEAEDFTIESGWKVVQNGHGNYMVDMVGFNHISGERLLCIDEKNETASAFIDVTVPVAGKFKLWVRYEYPTFTETRFRVIVEQGGKVLDVVMGKKDSLRHGFGDPVAKAQHDPSWGSEGLFEEGATIANLAAGKARIFLKGAEQPQIPGVSAHRNIDLIYLTSDTTDAWRKHYTKQTNLYPILEAFRDTRGPRWQVRFTNRGSKKADIHITHVYNRIPWGWADPASVRGLDAGKSSDWIGMLGQDTVHFSMTQFKASEGPFDVELRPASGTQVTRKLSGDKLVQVYVPPYPGKGETPTTPEEAIDAILADLKKHLAPGKKPTKPLCYGGWMPLGQENDYGRKYARLYAELGFRSLHPANSGPAQVKNLQAVGVPISKSWMVMSYRNPPTKKNIDSARAELARNGLGGQLRFFDYGDEIAFGEWFSMLLADEIARTKSAGKPLTEHEAVARRWFEWLKANRPKARPVDYWLAAWGPFNIARLRPDSSAAAAAGNPRLYVDSLLFYEESAIRFAAEGAKAVRGALGSDVLCGANYSCHPFYYPHSTMYVKWFRGGAADMGRHSEYFWQVNQAGPMINGYVAEHFRAGMRDNPRAVLRQYTMPHSPGNIDANFLRSVFSHLAHGATMLDFFGIGLNESFTENHIDFRDRARYRSLRDVTHCVGLVEDLLPAAKAVPSDVALLVSESTERWDMAGIATDRAGHAHFGPEYRKTRLHFHLERLGLWKALTFLGSTPDLLIEEDVNSKRLKGYKVLVLVGDHWPAEMISAVQTWVNAGGTVLSTAAAGLRDPYGEKTDAWHKLAGLKNVETEQRTTFLRPRLELPFIKPLDTVTAKSWKMPALATKQRAAAEAGTVVLAHFDDKSPAVFERTIGKGRIVHVAAHPGLAYLWSALQPPAVPDRSPGTHVVPTNWDAGARALLSGVLETAGVEPAIVAQPELIDARLLKAPGGYVLPVANYHGEVGQKVTLKVRVGRKVVKAISAYHGEVPVTYEGGRAMLTLPALGYGDVVRLEVGK